MVDRKLMQILKGLAFLLYLQSTTSSVIDTLVNGSSSLDKSTDNELRTLVKLSADGQSLSPISRSYNGGNWENVAGKYTSLDIQCEESDTFCTVALPPLEDNSMYQVRSMTYTLSMKDEFARFLEQATFGPTQVSLQYLIDLSQDENKPVDETIATFIYDQMYNESTTSHREWYRHRVLHRFEPNHIARSMHACEMHTRYRRASISSRDWKKYVTVKQEFGRVSIYNGEYIRTVVDSLNWSNAGYRSSNGDLDTDNKSYYICSTPGDGIQRTLSLQDPNTRSCQSISYNGLSGVPPVQFFAGGALPTKIIELQESDLNVTNQEFFVRKNPNEVYSPSNEQEIIITRQLDDKLCPDIAAEYDEVPVFGYRVDTGEYFIHDPPPKLLANSLDDPAPDGGSSSVAYTDGITKCVNVERNFVNEKYCKLSDDISSCGRTASSALDITLNHESLKTIYETTLNSNGHKTRYVYIVNNLRIDADSNTVSPCRAGSKSRWIPLPENDSSCTNTLQETTKTRLKSLLAGSNDNNQFMRDILNEGGGCHADDNNEKDFLVDVNGACWKHVHQDYLQVFDFTYWTRDDTHAGNSANRNPIKEFAEAGDDLFYLDFPGWHGMDRWVTNRGLFTEVGRYGDTIAYSEFPPLLINSEIATAFGGEEFSLNGAGVLVCGSPYEVSNDPTLGGTQGKGAFDVINHMNRTTNGGHYYTQKQTVWTMTALNAPDQIRQRAAWALSQIFTVAKPFVQTVMNTEQHTMFYDIFIRHAFGSFRDILKEVAYSPIMGENLSFLDGRSTYFQWKVFKNVAYADENFAREVMQLFTVGPCKLNMDGTKVLEEDGSCTLMYTNDDVMEYARAWTGFQRNPERGGLEASFPLDFHDPMYHRVDWRDTFPKMGLGGQYIGDKLPLCSDRPKKHFLNKQAKYILLGASSRPTKHTDPLVWSTDPDTIKMKLKKPKSDHSDYLYTYLCNPDEVGKCRPEAVVYLPKDLKCRGNDCKVDTVRVVQVTPNLFYEYVSEPCVHQAFYKNAVKTNSQWAQHAAFCSDPRIDSVASPACCTSQTGTSTTAVLNQKYYGERTSLNTAIRRCKGMKLAVCNYPHVRNQCRDGRTQCNHGGQYWSKKRCAMFAKVNPEGKIAIVHDQSDTTGPPGEVNKNSLVYFRVHWKNNKFPTPEKGCEDNSYCTIYNDMCVCEVQVRESMQFKTMPTREDALNLLHIGAFDPKYIGYVVCDEQNGVKMHCRNRWKAPFKKYSIFEVVDDYGRKVFLKNMKSDVTLKGFRRTSFRNPPHINNLLYNINDKRDNEHETDATIDHYVYNENTPPSVAIKLIQRFGISNPSPSFIKDVATAFKAGIYESNDKSFGNGEYGDLAATFAAILLHKESRSVVLDKDFSHGVLREPILRVLNFIRSMTVVPDGDKPLIEFSSLHTKIGQMSYEMKSVFGFYQSDFEPAGRTSQASLVSPESQLSSGPYIVGLMNGLYSLIKYGLTYWWDGFFIGRGGNPRRTPPFYDWSVGRLGFEPSGTTGTEVVDELSTLLTGGRLSSESRQIIAGVYDNQVNKDSALAMAQQLVISAPEFHATGLVERSGEARPEFVEPSPSDKDYKAVVFLYLDGGIDSFNMLVPKCEPLRSQYNAKRLSFALPDGKLNSVTLAEDSPPQPCDEFGIDKLLPDLHRSFEAGETLFFANAGVLNGPVDRKNYGAVTKTQLFAHNTMKVEAQRLDPYAKVSATGVLGRMMDELHNLDFKVNAISIGDTPVLLNGRVGESPQPITTKVEGALTYDPYPWSSASTYSNYDLLENVQELNNVTTIDSCVHSELWASDFLRVIDENKLLKTAIESYNPVTHFGNDLYSYSKKLAQVARLIKSKDIRGVDRDAFFVEFIKFDTHQKQVGDLTVILGYLQRALDSFWKEMKAQGNFDNVVMVCISDFARTLSPNSSDGTDHAWGGHYFMTGGKVRGKRIMGEYPDDLDGPLNIDGANDGRGRFIPTTAFEGIWNGVSQWMGVDEEDALDRIMPNRQTCGSTYMFDEEDLFKD